MSSEQLSMGEVSAAEALLARIDRRLCLTPEEAEAVAGDIADRRRELVEARREVKHWKEEAERAHRLAEARATGLAEFEQGAARSIREMRASQGLLVEENARLHEAHSALASQRDEARAALEHERKESARLRQENRTEDVVRLTVENTRLQAALDAQKHGGCGCASCEDWRRELVALRAMVPRLVEWIEGEGSIVPTKLVASARALLKPASDKTANRKLCEGQADGA